MVTSTDNPPGVVMGQLTLEPGTIVHVAVWPVYLTASTVVETNAANVPLIEKDLAMPRAVLSPEDAATEAPLPAFREDRPDASDPPPQTLADA